MGGVCEARDGQQQTLGEAVQALMQEDTGCSFLVRGVNALGLESEELLRSHYSGYGRVRRVLVVHSGARCWAGNGALSARQVPANGVLVNGVVAKMALQARTG